MANSSRRNDSETIDCRVKHLEDLLYDAIIQINKLQERIQNLEEENILHRNQIEKFQHNNTNTSNLIPIQSLNLHDNHNVSNRNDNTNEDKKNQSNENRNTTLQSTTLTNSIIKTRMGNNVFTRWMNSQEEEFSLWKDRKYSKSLLFYIGKMYGEETNVEEIVAPLRIGSNNHDELYQLYLVIKRFEEQPGAKESLRKWQEKNRTKNRLFQFQKMFKSINSKSIQTYFDLICRDGFITAEIGKYLQLNQENILGGDEYNSHNKDITYVKIDLNQSKIDLMDNHIDLITCFVVLHHVPDLDLMLREIVRIMRLNGYLIVREHDCKKERSLTNKYLNFIHAFMRIAEIGEYAHRSNDNSTNDWELQKKEIIEETSSIQYRTRQEWKKKLEEVGFCLIAEIDYDSNIKNPQVLYHHVYQLKNKQ